MVASALALVSVSCNGRDSARHVLILGLWDLHSVEDNQSLARCQWAVVIIEVRK
jgi:hypothetical protein